MEVYKSAEVQTRPGRLDLQGDTEIELTGTESLKKLLTSVDDEFARTSVCSIRTI